MGQSKGGRGGLGGRARFADADDGPDGGALSPEGSQIHRTRFGSVAAEEGRHHYHGSAGGGGPEGGSPRGGGGEAGVKLVLALEAQVQEANEKVGEKIDAHSKAIMHMARQIDVLQKAIKAKEFNTGPESPEKPEKGRRP